MDFSEIRHSQVGYQYQAMQIVIGRNFARQSHLRRPSTGTGQQKLRFFRFIDPF
jgi:hypothetical protein